MIIASCLLTPPAGWKRIVRIEGFLVNFWFCLVVLGPDEVLSVFYWRNFICARNKFLWINKINSPRDLRNVPNYSFLSKVNLMDLTSSKIENTSFPLNIVLTHTHLTNTKLRIFFKGDNNSFSSDDWASVSYFLNINLIGLRSQNISEDPKKTASFCLEHPWCGNKSNFYFVYAGTPQSRLVTNCASYPSFLQKYYKKT